MKNNTSRYARIEVRQCPSQQQFSVYTVGGYLYAAPDAASALLMATDHHSGPLAMDKNENIPVFRLTENALRSFGIFKHGKFQETLANARDDAQRDGDWMSLGKLYDWKSDGAKSQESQTWFVIEFEYAPGKWDTMPIPFWFVCEDHAVEYASERLWQTENGDRMRVTKRTIVDEVAAVKPQE